MKNQKGFSIIELIVSFSVCLVIAVILFQIVISLRELYEQSGLTTELLNKQNIIVDKIYDDILSVGLESASSCGTYCVEFKFKNASIKTFKYESAKLFYDDYVTNLNNGVTVGNISINTQNNVVSIQLPITHKLFPKDNFDIQIVHILNQKEEI